MEKEWDIIKKAFLQPLASDSAESVDLLVRKCDYVAEKWLKGGYQSPSFLICNGSMTGKSRHIREIAQLRPVVYICLRVDNSSGFPCRSKVTDDLLAFNEHFEIDKKEYNRHMVMHRFVAFIQACIIAMAFFVGEKRKDEITADMFDSNGEIFWDKVAEELGNFEHWMNPREFIQKHITYFSDIHKYQDLITTLLQETISSCQGTLERKSTEVTANIGFVFDECRTLLDRKAGIARENS